MEPISYTERTCIIEVEIDSDTSTLLIGIVVDAVSDVLNIREEEIEDTPKFATQLKHDYVLGMAKRDGGGCSTSTWCYLRMKSLPVRKPLEACELIET